MKRILDNMAAGLILWLMGAVLLHIVSALIHWEWTWLWEWTWAGRIPVTVWAAMVVYLVVEEIWDNRLP